MRRLLFSTLLISISGLVGCGGSVEPDVPATLTPEMEQEILNQVEGNSAQEEGQLPE